MNIDNITATASVSLADKARKMEIDGEKIIKLQTGDPFFKTHNSIIEAANLSLKNDNTHYSFAQGLPNLRRKIAENINVEIKGFLTEKNIMITHGAVQGLFSVFSSILEHNNEVLILEPNWSTVDSAVIMNGGIPVKINSFSENDITKLLEQAYNFNTIALCFNSPCNPTGKTFSKKTIQNIVKWAIKKDIYIIADEVYRFLQYEHYVTSLFTINSYNKYIFIDSFSKKFAMTGWRIGYIAANEKIIKKTLKASQINITHVAPFIQIAALEAISNKKIENYSRYMKKIYFRRRQLIIDILISNNIDFIRPDGAFYFFIKLKEFTDDVFFTDKLLNKYKVCVVPGSAYGATGKGYIRVSFSGREKDLIEGLNRVALLYNEIVNPIKFTK
jgi:aspartate/methionine/tyrosine aminotransferase